MDTRKLIIIIGIITLLISIITWIMDFTGLVAPCIYCRSERTVIGLIGLLLLLPKHKLISPYLAVTLGFYGSYVAADQIFTHIIEGRFGIMFSFAIGALLVILLQVFVLYGYLHRADNDSSNHR